MARLTAPLLSLGASGTIGKAITFASWKGIPYARTRVVPANPNTLAQQEVRGVFATLGEMWKRMPEQARLPFTHAARGQPLTSRNKHIQANIAALQNDANLDDLVMSVAGGGAVVPINVTAVDGTNGRVACFCEAPSAPVGYTIGYMVGVAVRDGDPSPAIVLPTYVTTDPSSPYAFDIYCLEDDRFQVGIFAVWVRDSDLKSFCSSAVRFQVDVTGTP